MVGVHHSVNGVDLEVLVRTDGGGLLNSTPVSERWLGVVEPGVGQVLHVVGVHPGDTLGNLGAGHTAAKSKHLLADLGVDTVGGLVSHERVPEAVSATDDLDLSAPFTPGDWNGDTGVVHRSGEDLVSEEVVTPKTAVRVGQVLAISKSHVNEISEETVHTVVLLVSVVKVNSVLVDAVVANHMLEESEGIVVWVLDAWSIEEDTNVGVVHLIISHHEEGWNVNALVLSTTGTSAGLTDRLESLSDLLNEGIVVNGASSDDNHVVTKVVGSLELSESISSDVANEISISLDWLSHLVVSESVVVNGFHGSSLHVLVTGAVGSGNLLLGEFELAGVEGWVGNGIGEELDGTADVTLEAGHLERGSLTVDISGEASTHALNLLSEVSLGGASGALGEHLSEEVGRASSLVKVITGSSTNVDTNTIRSSSC